MGLGLATLASVVAAELNLPPDEVQTLRWTGFFVAGILIARHRHAIVAAWRRLPGVARVLLFILAITLYSSHYLWPRANLTRDTVDSLISGAGSALLVVGVLSEERLAKPLAAPALQLLGRVSYSLYLLHAVVLVTVIRLLGGLIPPLVAEAMALAFVLPLAMLCYRYVERPGIQLGRLLSAKLEGRMRTNAKLVPAPEPVTR
jgi:peptidoglycan/LPS O-acetylase OafA/YrhL